MIELTTFSENGMNRLIHLLSALLLCSVLAACATQGKPGTPLPPQNKAVGEKWAPEVRQFIDALLTEFQDGKPAPTVEQIEKVFGVKVIAKAPDAYKIPGIDEYELQGWALRNPSVSSWSANYLLLPAKSGTQSQSVRFVIDTQRYCIDPYDFAIYAGASAGAAPDGSPEHNPYLRDDGSYAPVYAWGMFNRSPYGMYIFFDERSVGNFRLTDDRRCIWIIEKQARFIVRNN